MWGTGPRPGIHIGMADDGLHGIGAVGQANDGARRGIRDAAGGGTVSLRAEVPEHLLRAMAQFIECHPNWDQYRLFQAALAGFLVQNGVQDRGVTRCYLANLFPSARGFERPLAGPAGERSAAPLPRQIRSEGGWTGDHRSRYGRHAA